MTYSIQYTYIAAKPIRAEHPVGSGTIVDYKPGDVIPAEEWGRAADALVEMGKAFRTAMNVFSPETNTGAPMEAATVQVTVTDGESVSAAGDFPRHVGAGVFELSDGSRVKGKAAAVDAEFALKGES